MISRCRNKLELRSHVDDQEKLKSLVFNSKTNEVDYNIACPFLAGLEGTFLPGLKGLYFNKVFDGRLGLLNTEDFIKLLRQRNASNKEVASNIKCFIRMNTHHIKDSKAIESRGFKIPILSRKRKYEHSANKEDPIKAELFFIDRLASSLKSSPSYTPHKPIEDILEHLLNDSDSKVVDTALRPTLASDSDYVAFLGRQCPPEIGYALCVLSDSHQNKCLEVFGYRDAHDWCKAHWGTRWNAIDTQIFDEHKTTSFVSYSTPPTEWVIRLASKAKEMGVREFGATLKYIQAGGFGGGELIVSQTGDYHLKDYDDDIELITDSFTSSN